MSFPDVSNQEDPFSEVQEGAENIEKKEQEDFTPIQDEPQSTAQPEMMTTNVIDEEEQERINKRNEEEAERRKKITEKMDLELKVKNERREKAVEFLNDFENKRQEEIALRKQTNIKNEEDNLANRKLIKEGKVNPWENVVENITMKESEYKGSKDVSRMRAVLLSRKNDQQHLNK